MIGVLALQGDFAKHQEKLHLLGEGTKEIRKPEDLDQCVGLVIPGGESTVMFKQIEFAGMRELLLEFGKKYPIFGTCAGLIVMSSKILNFPSTPLGILDVTVERNAYGRQIDSFQTLLETRLSKESKQIEAFFIRAPRIKAIGSDVEVLASYQNEPVLIRQGKHLASCFHPELTKDLAIHQYFISIVKKFSQK